MALGRSIDLSKMFIQFLLINYLAVLCSAVIYTNDWAVHIEGGEEHARALAEKYNYDFDKVIFPDIYHFKHRIIAKRSTRHSHQFHKALAEEKSVKWLEQQQIKRRVKRMVNDNDNRWSKMWYLNRGHCQDMNAERAWIMGYTGKGSVVTILDDGIEYNHPDLAANYDPEASYDINDHDADPFPRYDIFNYNRHGTRCAGEVAAVANNTICSIGIAYNAKIGGIRMLDGDITDLVEAQSIGYNQAHIDIYSASWGPDDDGRTVDGPGALAKHAFKKGIIEGRHGKGNIFVWASGNGGRSGDSCSCDGYTNSLYTLSVSSATERGTVPWYSEPCASTLATTYSSGSGSDGMIITTDLKHACTDRHTGTSASAPLAAGVIAVVLEANNRLTWRDMQHIVVRTANPKHLHTNDWVTNGAGLKVSHSFGFGMMDTAAMVDLAKSWTCVQNASLCNVPGSSTVQQISKNAKFSASVSVQADSCNGVTKKLHFLEHVQLKLTLTASRRGDVSIFLISPSGTKSTLLPLRPHDSASEGFKDWEFLSVHSWGESPTGKWTLEIVSKVNAALHSWDLILHGTETVPAPYTSKRFDCNTNTSSNGVSGVKNEHKNITNVPSNTIVNGSTSARNRDKNDFLAYSEYCIPGNSRCGQNMVCITKQEEYTGFRCRCLPSLIYNEKIEECEFVTNKDLMANYFVNDEKSHNLDLLTKPVFLIVIGMFVLMVVGTILVLVLFQFRNYKKYGTYHAINNHEMPIFNMPNHRM